MVDYRPIQSFVPEWIRKLVKNDNTAFIVDR